MTAAYVISIMSCPYTYACVFGFKKILCVRIKQMFTHNGVICNGLELEGILLHNSLYTKQIITARL